MGRLRVTVIVPGRIEDVFRAVTACDATGALVEANVRNKYGRLLQTVDGVHIFEEDREEKLQWRVTFQPPTRRVMEAVDPKWSDRSDDFQGAAHGTKWIVTWTTRARGPVGLVQWMFFQFGGKKRVMREVVQPVLDAFPPASGSPGGQQGARG